MSELEFRLPDVGEGLSEGEIVEWAVVPGERVARDQTLLHVQTDKSVVELPAPHAGTVVRIEGAVGDIVPVGALLVVIAVDEPAATLPAGPVASFEPQPGVIEEPRTPQTPPAASPRGRAGRGRPLASPATRQRALEHGIDLATISGTGPGGRITTEDVERAARDTDEAADADAAHPPPAAVPTAEAVDPGRSAGPAAGGGAAAGGDVAATDEVVPLRGLRRRIAMTMAAAWRDVPHITDIRELDATGLVDARTRLGAALEPQGVHLTFLPLFVAAAAAALRAHPACNASLDLDAGTVTYRRRVNIGLAVATGDGLIVPVLHDADRRSIAEVAQASAELATAARERRLSPAQTAGGTFTITNFGTYGGWIGTPIIRPPEAAIAGFGRIRETVVAVDGVAVVRPTLAVSVSADHRLLDGDDVGAFLATLTTYLTDPLLLLGVGGPA